MNCVYLHSIKLCRPPLHLGNLASMQLPPPVPLSIISCPHLLFTVKRFPSQGCMQFDIVIALKEANVNGGGSTISWWVSETFGLDIELLLPHPKTQPRLCSRDDVNKRIVLNTHTHTPPQLGTELESRKWAGSRTGCWENSRVRRWRGNL